MAVVDSHVHLWEFARRPQPWIDPRTMPMLCRDFTSEDLATVIASAGVVSTVLVQVLNQTDETIEYLDIAARSPFIGAVVGWVDVTAVDLADRLDELCAAPGGHLLTGIRHQAQAEPDPGAWLVRPEVSRGLAMLGERGLVCDLMLMPAQLTIADAVIATCPGTRFVLDHAGKPPIAAGWGSAECVEWERRMRRLARHENLSVKLSGLTTLALPGPADRQRLQPFVDILFDAFGTSRVLFGSDWPVSTRATSYERTVELAREFVADLTPAERAAVLAENSTRLYRLPA